MALRINFVDVIVDDSLKKMTTSTNEVVGYKFDIFLSNYRGHYLSCIDKFELTVNGEHVDPRVIRFCINEKEFPVNDLRYLRSEYWKLTDKATIKVIDLGDLTAGNHNIKLDLELRVPYMPIPVGEHNYVPLDSSGEKMMSLGGNTNE